MVAEKIGQVPQHYGANPLWPGFPGRSELAKTRKVEIDPIRSDRLSNFALTIDLLVMVAHWRNNLMILSGSQNMCNVGKQAPAGKNW
ncbi:hypothetical protein V2G26_017450 [Clonostachys chloroleuca]